MKATHATDVSNVVIWRTCNEQMSFGDSDTTPLQACENDFARHS
jgi:hypothetical protein